MILEAFSEYLRGFNTDIPPVKLLSRWLKDILSKPPSNNIENIIHTELALLETQNGIYLIIGKDKSGKILIESLYNFALSYEQQNFNRWLHNVKASDFNTTKNQ